MSASTEKLLEQIKLTEEALAVARRDAGAGAVVAQCEADLKYLQRKLQVCNEALTEGKHVLKG